MGQTAAFGGTKTQFIDPLSRQSYLVEDRVTLQKWPKGPVTDFKIKDIGNDDTILLGPLSDTKFSKPVASLARMKLGQSIVEAAPIKLRSGDTVTLVDKAGNRVDWRVHYFLDKGYLVLVRPGAPKLGIADMLKFGWNVYWK